MSFKNLNFKKIFLCLYSLTFLLLTNCLYNQSQRSILSFPSVGEDSSLSDSNYFYLDLDEGHYDILEVEVPLYDISTTESYGDAETRNSVSNCEIGRVSDDPESDPSETKICILDIMENDLVVNDLRIIYNLPEGMCKYVEISPPWHYNYEVGLGPEEIYECQPPEPAEGETSLLESVFCTVLTQETRAAISLATEPLSSDYTCEGASTTASFRCSIEKEDLCAYNYKTDSDEDISCCYGTYRNRTSGSREAWGGNDGLKQCLGGPGRSTWQEFSNAGFPATRTQSVSKYGVKGFFEVESLIKSTNSKQFSVPIANFLKVLDKKPENLRKVFRRDLPKFLRDPNIGVAGSRPNLFFSVECLDSAGEVLHKLQLMVREWNTHEEFIAFYNAEGSDGPNPDVTGTEGKDCSYEERATLNSEDYQCNDSRDFDDIGINEFPQVFYQKGQVTGTGADSN